MPRRSERKGMTLEEKAKFHANAIYNVPLRLYKTVDKFTFIYVPLTLGNSENPPEIKSPTSVLTTTVTKFNM